MQIVVYGRDLHSGLRHGEPRLRCVQIIQDHFSRYDLPVVKALAINRVGLNDNKFALQGCIGLGIFHIGLAAVHRDAQQLLILCDGGHRRIRHDKGGLFRILVKHSNIAVVHFPTVEHIARAALGRDGDGLALNGGFLVCSAELHADLVQSLEHSLQGHFPSGHRKLEGLVLQLLLRQAVHTGHFPVAELLACGGRVCRCNDGVALFGCRCGAAIDGKGAAFNGDAVEFLVLCLYLHVFTLHGKGRGRALGIGQLHVFSLVDHPAVKHVARAVVSSNGDFSTLFCLRQGCSALEHCNCMEFCVVRGQSHIVCRHFEVRVVHAVASVQRNAVHFPIFKDVAVFFIGQRHNMLSFKRLCRCRTSVIVHLDCNIVGRGDGVVLLVIWGQGHVLVRHGKGDFFCFQLVRLQHAVRVNPVGKLCVFSVCCGHGDLFARKGSLQFCTLPLQLDGCIFCSIDVVAHFRRNAHILCRFYWDGHNIRVNCSICCIIGVVTIITSVGNALCNSAVLVLFKKGRRAGAFNFHIATDRRIALAFDLHTFRAVYGKVSANSRPRIVIRYNGQLPGAGNIYIFLNRCKFLTGNRHILRIFNCQDTVLSAILQCKILAIQLYIHVRCIDSQKSLDGSI